MNYYPETKNKQKKLLSNKLKIYQTKKIYKAAETKSKVRDYICNKTKRTVMMKPTYMDNLSRTECASIFNTRARMIKVKGNYKNKYNDKNCRWCQKYNETQTHILTECTQFKSTTKNVEYKTYYNDDNKSAKIAARTLALVINKINQNPT